MYATVVPVYRLAAHRSGLIQPAQYHPRTKKMSTYKQGFVCSCVAVVLLAQLAAISGQRFAVPDVKANVESLREGAVAADGGSTRLLPFLDPAVLDRYAQAAQ